jgi:RraA family protein
MSIGFRVFPLTRRADPQLIGLFAKLPVANVSDSMGRMFSGGASLRPMHAGGVLAGPAVTVKTRPGDNLMIHYALDTAEPGDVIVVDAGGDMTNALIGELMIAHAVQRQLAGMVIFGAIRDSAEIRGGTFPVYAVGVTHRGPYKDGPGEVNVPVAVDGMVVMPGDVVLGDADGVVAVGIDQASEVYRLAAAKHAAETAQMAKIREGKNPREWVMEALRRAGCEGI